MKRYVYVGGVNYAATDQELLNHFFSHFGTVISGGVAMDSMTGRSKGLGFIEMENAEQARLAIDLLNNTDFMGRKITVAETRPSERSLSPGSMERFMLNRKYIKENKYNFQEPFPNNGEVFKIDYDLSEISILKDVKPDVDKGAETSAETDIENEHISSKFFLEVKTIKKVIYEIYENNALIYDIEPRLFEELIAELLSQKGYSVDLTKQTRDGGYDILALSSDNGMPLKYLVECKKYRKDRKVGIEIIRSFSDVIKEQNANKGIIFTTSFFTEDARKRQRTNPYFLELKDHDEVINWVKEYKIGF